MKKFTLITAFASLIFLSACSTPSQPTELATTGNTTATTPSTETLPAETSSPNYTLKDVSIHSTATDCRTTIASKVYNLTPAFGKHKGGDDKLLLLCGKDGTALFTGKHGSNDKAKAMLASLLIGSLK